MNLQHGNVGNLGDILKHSAIDALARLIAAEHPPGQASFVDSHAYLLSSRLANPLWREQTESLAMAHPGYRAYQALQAPFVARGGYLCSSGIVHRHLPQAHFILCETDRVTRARLAGQVREAQLERVTLLSDAAQCCTAQGLAPAGRFLGLVDPFELTPSDWQAGLCAVRRLHRPGEDGLMAVFGYARDEADLDWPAPPEGWSGPVARIDSPPYHLGVYASGPIRRRAADALEPLGWRR
jgi:hypothetical protein